MRTPHAVVIGAGLGGLAAAVRLRARGYRVTVIEALDRLGGRARVLERDGFTFDMGPTVITAPYLIDELFTLLGADRREHVELVPLDPFYRLLFPDGSQFDFVGDEERLLNQIARFEPRDVDGYRRLAWHARRIFDVGYSQLADKPFHDFRDVIRVLPSMARLRSDRSVYDVVARYIRDDRLRQVFSFESLLVGGNPFTTTSIYLLIHWLERKWGVHYARGGTGAVVTALARLLEVHGVDVRTGEAMQEILIEHGRAVGVRVRGASGERVVRADIVVCNADPDTVYRDNVAARWRPVLARRRMRQSMSLFVAYFGTRTTYPDLAHHTVVFGPRYRELLGDIFQRQVLAEDMSLYLHAPTRTDPSMAPAGHESFYVLAPVPNARAGVNWTREAPRYFDRVMAMLERRVLPNVNAELVTTSWITPDTFAGDLRSMDGAAFGPEPRLTQSAWFRHHNKSSIPGLYFVGAGTHPGAGIPGVLNSAKVLERLLGRECWAPDTTDTALKPLTGQHSKFATESSPR
jgi:phytoene desaturase